MEYLAQGAAASPLQHFWSLAVEEQFYIVWPLLIVALTWWARRRRRSAAVDGERGLSVGRLTAGLLVIVLPSLAWSVYLTATDPGPAYFVTTTRLWELGIGALLAVGAVQAARAPVALRAVAGWAGLAAIGWSAVMFTAETRFPGAAALVPTLGAAAVLWAGLGDGRARVRVLDVAPLQDVGALSYSLYLWHWPVLVAATALWGDKDGHLWLPTALLAVAASAVPAWFTYRVVEQPLHLSPLLAAPWRAGVAGVVCVAIGLGSAGAITWSLDRQREATVAAPAPAPDLFGAAALGDDPTTSPAGIPVNSVISITPDPIDTGADVARLDGEKCIAGTTAAQPVRCSYGPADAEVTLAVVGDSKMHQWLPALQELADRGGWRILTYLKSGCPLFRGTVAMDGMALQSCQVENNARVDEVLDDPSIDVVIASQVSSAAWIDPAGGDDARAVMSRGLQRVWSELTKSGKRVIVLADNQGPPFQEIDCVAAHLTHLTDCAFPKGSVEGTTLVTAARAAGIPVVDMSNWICPREMCAPVIGGVMVYRQGSHITATYVRTLADALGKRLTEAGLP